MKVRNCLIDVEVTVKYQSGSQSAFSMQLRIVEGDDILSLIEQEVLDYVNIIGTSKDYKTFTMNTMRMARINKETTCRACLEDQPNQEAHAKFPGDCLYIGSQN